MSLITIDAYLTKHFPTIFLNLYQ